MRIKILVSPDGKKSIVASNKQQSSFTPIPITHQNKDHDSDYNESVASQSKLSKYQKAEDDSHEAPREPYLSETTKGHAGNTDGDIEMTDAPEEVTNHIQISMADIMKNQSSAGNLEAISTPATSEDSPTNVTAPEVAIHTAAETLESKSMAYSTHNKVTVPGPAADIGVNHTPDKPIPTVEALSTLDIPYSITPTEKPNPSPIAYYDATYAFYVDGVYEFWSMGLKRTQVAGFIRFLGKRSLEDQKTEILKLMKQVTKRRSWKRLVRKDGDAARKARDSAVLSSVRLTEMAGVTVENGKAVKYEEKNEIKVEETRMEDWSLAWIHIREFEDKNSEIWMVGKGFTIDNMVYQL